MPNWSALIAAIGQAEAAGATVGLSVVAPGGARFSHNGQRAFPAASTIKTAIMITLFRRVDAGSLDLAARHTLSEADRTGGSGVLTHLDPGLAPTLADLAYLMMSISDNAATNILIERLGMAEINATMRALGMPRSILGRPMRGRLAEPGEQENLAWPDEFADMIGAILSGRAAGPAGCARMQALLQAQQNDRRIARHLPRDNRPRWGSKTGSNRGVVNDVGFIDTPAGPLVIAAFTQGIEDPLAAEALVGDLARLALAA